MKNSLVRCLSAVAMLTIGSTAGAVTIYTLDTWNVDDIQNSGDIVEVVVDTNSLENTIATFQWQEGDTTDDLWTAIGLDTIFYNSDAPVIQVLDQDGVDVTSDWSLNFGGLTGGGGFGNFLSQKNLESGGLGGIDPDSITLVFGSAITFSDNGSPHFATFDVHVRYGGDCSGWASDGITTSDTSETTTCRPRKIAEPGTLALVGLGLLGVGLTRRRRTI